MTATRVRSSYPSNRLISLDVFRGLTMMSMVLVNNPGDWEHVYPPLLHSEWNGCTFTDLIFPFFLFIVGTSMAFSFARRLQEGNPQQLLHQIIKRTVILFAIGFLLNESTYFLSPSIRILGVLQRIALCYFFVSLMALYGKPSIFWIAGTTLLAVYTVGMLFIPVPGYGAGVLQPEGSFCWWVDHLILRGYTWQYAPAKGFDPEGVWSTLPAIVTAILGYKAGLLLRSDRQEKDKLIGLFLRGNLCLLMSYLTMAVMPINKQLWSVPYVFLCAGLAYLGLGMLYYWIDMQNHRKGLTPALVYGSNAILIYVLSDIGAVLLEGIKFGSGETQRSLGQVLYQSLFLSWANPINASLAMGLAYILVLLGIAYILYRKRIFIKV